MHPRASTRRCRDKHTPGARCRCSRDISNNSASVLRHNYSLPIQIHTQGMSVLRSLEQLKACCAVHMTAGVPSSDCAGTLCCSTSPASSDCNGARQGCRSSRKYYGYLRSAESRHCLPPPQCESARLRPSRLSGLLAHNEPSIPKQCSNASWRHACPLLIKPVPSGDKLRVCCVRHRVFRLCWWSSGCVPQGQLRGHFLGIRSLSSLPTIEMDHCRPS